MRRLLPVGGLACGAKTTVGEEPYFPKSGIEIPFPPSCFPAKRATSGRGSRGGWGFRRSSRDSGKCAEVAHREAAPDSQLSPVVFGNPGDPAGASNNKKCRLVALSWDSSRDPDVGRTAGESVVKRRFIVETPVRCRLTRGAGLLA